MKRSHPYRRGAWPRLAICAPAAAKEFRSSDVHPEDYPTVMAVKYMSDIIKQKTGGKDSIKVYTMSQLGSEKDTIEQTKIGALDFVRINVAPMNNICPETMVPTMPFLFRSKEHMRKVLDGPIGDADPEGLRNAGLHRPRVLRLGLALAVHGQEAGQVARRRQGHEDPRPAVGPLGRAAAGDGRERDADARTARSTRRSRSGVVDGAENNWPSYDTSRHFEVAKYYAITDHSMAPEMLLMSKKVYDALTPDEQTDHPRRGQGVGALHAQAVGREGARVAEEGRGGRRADRRSRQEVVLRTR